MFPGLLYNYISLHTGENSGVIQGADLKHQWGCKAAKLHKHCWGSAGELRRLCRAKCETVNATCAARIHIGGQGGTREYEPCLQCHQVSKGVLDQGLLHPAWTEALPRLTDGGG